MQNITKSARCYPKSNYLQNIQKSPVNHIISFPFHAVDYLFHNIILFKASSPGTKLTWFCPPIYPSVVSTCLQLLCNQFQHHIHKSKMMSSGHFCLGIKDISVSFIFHGNEPLLNTFPSDLESNSYATIPQTHPWESSSSRGKESAKETRKQLSIFSDWTWKSLHQVFFLN